MTQSEFKLLFADQVMKCEETLQNKRKEYTGDNQDRLSSFKVAASLQGCTPQRALVGMMAKHIVSLYDMCYAKNAAFKKELWDEKITDSVFCKHFLEKNAKYFWRMLHLQIGESCKASAGSYSASYIAIADHI